MKTIIKKQIFGLLSLLLILLPARAIAQTYSSGSYQIDEATFGSGGEVDTNSASYNAQGAAGIMGVGDSSSDSYDATAGLITPNQVYLELFVTNTVIDLGILDPTDYKYGSPQSGACNCSFFVRTYLSDEYVVTTLSDPPKSEGGAMLAPKTILGVPSSSDSVEEFGMNVVANTTPASGANPVNVPDNSFADGQAAPGYDTPNQFKYNKGDIIARSAATLGNQATGQTNYTVTYIAKSKPTTPAGLYTMYHDIVVTARY